MTKPGSNQRHIVHYLVPAGLSVHNQNLEVLTQVLYLVSLRLGIEKEGSMGSQEPEKHLEDCSVSNALGTWVFSVGGALIAIPVGIKRKSLAPLVFYGTTGTMLDIIMGVTACEREHAERQKKLLEAQNPVVDASFVETEAES